MKDKNPEKTKPAETAAHLPTALKTVVDALDGLNAEERERVVKAAAALYNIEEFQ